MSQAYEQLVALGGEMGTYTPSGKPSVQVLALVDPMRRADTLGHQSFMTKTYDIWIVKSLDEGMATVKAGYDTLAFKLNDADDSETTLRITKISPERDNGTPGDGVGMWHLEAVI